MWTYFTFAALVAVVVAQGRPGGPGPSAGRMIVEVHDPKGDTLHHRGAHHQPDSHDTHDGYEEVDTTAANDEHIVIKMGGPPKNVEMYHGNPYPGAAHMNLSHIYAVCQMRATGALDSDVSGTVYMRQAWMGCDAVTTKFDLQGLPHMESEDGHVHTHTLKIHRFGDLSDSCANVGAVFTPRHRTKPGNHAHDSSEEEEESDSNEDGEPDEGHNGGHNGGHKGHGRHGGPHGGHGGKDCDSDDVCCLRRKEVYGPDSDIVEGELGDFPCDADGIFDEKHDFNQFTVMGFHTVVGRSLVVSHMGHTLGCCTIATSYKDIDHHFT